MFTYIDSIQANLSSYTLCLGYQHSIIKVAAYRTFFLVLNFLMIFGFCLIFQQDRLFVYLFV